MRHPSIRPSVHRQRTLGSPPPAGCCREHGAQVPPETLLSVLSGLYPEVELLDHMVTIFKCCTVFNGGCAILHSYQQSPRVLASCPYQHWLIFDSSHPRCEVASHCSFGFSFSWCSQVSSISSQAWPPLSSLKKCLCSPLSLFEPGFCYYCCWVLGVLPCGY